MVVVHYTRNLIWQIGCPFLFLICNDISWMGFLLLMGNDLSYCSEECRGYNEAVHCIVGWRNRSCLQITHHKIEMKISSWFSTYVNVSQSSLYEAAEATSLLPVSFMPQWCRSSVMILCISGVCTIGIGSIEDTL